MPSSRCQMKWFLVCPGVSARFLHGFKTCKGCKSLQNRTKGAETRSSKPAIHRKEITLKRNFQKLRESPGVRYESVARGFQRVGMSTVKAVKSKDFMAFLFCEPWVHGCGKSETYLQKIQDGKDGISY